MKMTSQQREITNEIAEILDFGVVPSKSYFVNLTPAEIAALRERDRAVVAIKNSTNNSVSISFRWLRAAFGAQKNENHHHLNRGRAILQSAGDLDQYLYSYGPMIESQWREVCSWMPLNDDHFRLIDYGCGQGLAGLFLFDRLGKDWFGNAAKIVLVEPSAAALIRAEAIYRGIAPSCPIFCVRKKFDDLSDDDLVPDRDLDSFHIFSNVLDIAGFDHFEIFARMLTEGRHTVCVVSHDRDHNGGSTRINDLKAAVENLEGSRRSDGAGAGIAAC
ncbi:MAG TPA: hypothetical protein VGN83_17740 [Falsiroseomonas sp.]|jgi:hypothetical protein|nr:hypothetical protein [Falsiroseomonas sp.]